MWYPTQDAPHPLTAGSYSLLVARDAAVLEGTYELVMLSHGSGGSYFGHHDTALFLAQHGFIVVSILHPRNNYEDNADARTPANWINRPRHISATLDAMLKDPEFASHIDSKAIAVIGHSAGGVHGSCPGGRSS